MFTYRASNPYIPDAKDVIKIILIIAEKPSLARNIASALGKMKKGDGFLADDKYIVTWAFVHLFYLADI